jgi:translation initiation factor eIF-2B subunit beta
MSRCDKVILSPVGVMATGGLVCHTGGLMIAHAAKAHEVPLFSLASMYKLTPLHPIDSHTYNELLSPETIFRLQENDKMDNIEVIIPAYDYIPPKLVSLILTNMEGYTPENIYRAFNQLYGKQGTLNFAE